MSCKINGLLLFLCLALPVSATPNIAADLATTRVSVNQLFNYYNELAYAANPEWQVSPAQVNVTSLAEYLGTLPEQEADVLDSDIAAWGGLATLGEIAEQHEQAIQVYQYTYPNQCVTLKLVSAKVAQGERVVEMKLLSPYQRRDECARPMAMIQWMFIAAMFQFSDGFDTQALFTQLYDSLKAGQAFEASIDGVAIRAGFVGEQILMLAFEPA